jgi:tetratricopeptide (TPR) repeat protein
MLARAWYLLDRPEELLALARRTRLEMPGSATPLVYEVDALVASGHLEEVDRVVEESAGLQLGSWTPAILMIEASAELRARGQREAALRYATRAVDWYRSTTPEDPTNLRRRLARALYRAESWEEARVLERELAAEDPDRRWLHRGALGRIAARLGERDEALRISAELVEAPSTGWSTYLRACIAALLGEKEQAMVLLHEAIDQGFRDFESLRRHMDLETLRGYPPFEELVRPKG